jgi:hypothetical protein
VCELGGATVVAINSCKVCHGKGAGRREGPQVRTRSRTGQILSVACCQDDKVDMTLVGGRLARTCIAWAGIGRSLYSS